MGRSVSVSIPGASAGSVLDAWKALAAQACLWASSSANSRLAFSARALARSLIITRSARPWASPVRTIDHRQSPATSLTLKDAIFLGGQRGEAAA